MPTGTLFVVATPIGNLEDLSPRVRSVLAGVDRVAAEDTRHSGRLLAHLGVSKPMSSLHDHNEEAVAAQLVERLVAGESIALVCDAGTPLVSDPGFRLLRAAREADVTVSPVPGPCAAIAALCIAGLASDRFCFEGFLPAKSAARRRALEALATEARTMVVYESVHRLAESLVDMNEVLGDRDATIARELTKLHEDIRHGTLSELAVQAAEDPRLGKGEVVLVIAGAAETGTDDGELDRVLTALLPRMSTRDAVAAAVEITGRGRNQIYQRAQALAEAEG